jgi:hypothetical protein
MVARSIEHARRTTGNFTFCGTTSVLKQPEGSCRHSGRTGRHTHLHFHHSSYRNMHRVRCSRWSFTALFSFAQPKCNEIFEIFDQLAANANIVGGARFGKGKERLLGNLPPTERVSFAHRVRIKP